MSEWIEYKGSDEQIAEIEFADDVLFKYKNNFTRLKSSKFHSDWWMNNLDYYLICEPHPRADMICQWARTGQPVYWRLKLEGHEGVIRIVNWSCDFIPWHKHDQYEFSFTPFEEEV